MPFAGRAQAVDAALVVHAAPEDPDVVWDGTGGVLVAAEDVGDDFAGVGAACHAGVDEAAIGIDLAWAGWADFFILIIHFRVGNGFWRALFGCGVISCCSVVVSRASCVRDRMILSSPIRGLYLQRFRKSMWLSLMI